MIKRMYTAEVLKAVLEDVLEDVDDDQDYDDPDEPVMEDSDDKFSDLELDEEDADLDQAPPNSPPYTVSSFIAAAASTLSIASILTRKLATIITTWFFIATCSVDYNTELKPVEVKSFNSPVGPTTAIPERSSRSSSRMS